MSPLASNEHQRIATELTVAFFAMLQKPGRGTVYQGANITDRENWTENDRVPDVLVFSKGTRAEDRGTHWYGGLDFAVKVVSKGDRTLEKLEFYAAANTKELLVIDRDPWQLSLYRRRDDAAMQLVTKERWAARWTMRARWIRKSLLPDSRSAAPNVVFALRT